MSSKKGSKGKNKSTSLPGSGVDSSEDSSSGKPSPVRIPRDLEKYIASKKSTRTLERLHGEGSKRSLSEVYRTTSDSTLSSSSDSGGYYQNISEMDKIVAIQKQVAALTELVKLVMEKTDQIIRAMGKSKKKGGRSTKKSLRFSSEYSTE